MPLYNSTYLSDRSRNTSFRERVEMYSHTDKPLTDTFDIFLSHSFLDKSVVQGLYLELTAMGFSVYVDWIIDPDLDRSNVTKESAKRIRDRMKSCRALLLAISVNAAISKWMPWELGFIDGDKGLCAIIPISDSKEYTYKGYEYLKLYPYVKKANNSEGKEMLWVIESGLRYSTLNYWMIGGEVSSRMVDIDWL